MAKPKVSVVAENDIRTILRMPEGRRFLMRVLDMTGFRDSIFNENPHILAYNEGRRSIGVQIEEDLILTDAAGYASLLGEGLKNFIDSRQEQPNSDTTKESDDVS